LELIFIICFPPRFCGCLLEETRPPGWGYGAPKVLDLSFSHPLPVISDFLAHSHISGFGRFELFSVIRFSSRLLEENEVSNRVHMRDDESQDVTTSAADNSLLGAISGSAAGSATRSP
jgi:hypothetical protein